MADDFETNDAVMGDLADVRRNFQSLQKEIGNVEALSPLADTLRAVVSALPDIVYRLNSEGDIVFISDAIGQYGYDPKELIGCSIFELIHPADHAKARHRVNERRRGDRSTSSLELRFLTNDYETIDFELKESSTEEEAFGVSI